MNDNDIIYISIFIVLLGISNTLFQIEIKHIFYLIVIVICLYMYFIYRNEVNKITNEELEFKMNNLLPDNYSYKPKFLYLEPEFILLYDNIKMSLGSKNLTSFYRMIVLTDDILELKENFIDLTQSCDAPKNPNILLGETNYQEFECNNSSLKQCKDIYVKCNSIKSEIMNLANTLILNTNLNPTTEWIYLNFNEKLHKLLKKILIDIKSICNLDYSNDIDYKIGFEKINNKNLFDENYNLYLEN